MAYRLGLRVTRGELGGEGDFGEVVEGVGEILALIAVTHQMRFAQRPVVPCKVLQAESISAALNHQAGVAYARLSPRGEADGKTSGSRCDDSP
jgi:hypothetical protein